MADPTTTPPAPVDVWVNAYTFGAPQGPFLSEAAADAAAGVLRGPVTNLAIKLTMSSAFLTSIGVPDTPPPGSEYLLLPKPPAGQQYALQPTPTS